MDEEDIQPIRKCEECKTNHFCSRCIKNMHMCQKCGKITHDCDICGITMRSLSEIKRHQKESKICKKARMLTATTFQEQLKKLGINITPKHTRRSSLPTFTQVGVVS